MTGIGTVSLQNCESKSDSKRVQCVLRWPLHMDTDLAQVEIVGVFAIWEKSFGRSSSHKLDKKNLQPKFEMLVRELLQSCSILFVDKTLFTRHRFHNCQ
jgi:hypothetical protein